MAKRLSEQLAELSIRAKNAEDSVAATQKETHDKIELRRQQAHTAATAAVEKVSQEIKSTGSTAARDWNIVKAKIAADIGALKADAAQTKRALGAKYAESRADHLEWEAGFAIDYAIASVEQAKLAVLEAIDSRVEADETRQS